MEDPDEDRVHRAQGGSGDDARQLAEKKLAKIKKYFNDILDVRLEVAQERHLYVADLLVRGKDFDVKSTSQNKDLTTAIQDAIDKLEIQARRAKTRLKDHKSRAGRSEPSLAPAEEGAEPEPAPAGEAGSSSAAPSPSSR